MLEPTRTTGGGGGSDAEMPHDLNSALLKIASLDWQEGPAEGVESALEGVGEDWGAYTGLPPRPIARRRKRAHLLAPLSYRRPDGATGGSRPAPGSTAPRSRGRCGAHRRAVRGPLPQRLDRPRPHCITRSRTWPEVHRMFYEAMRCSGTGATKAKIMYYSVYRFGRRWPSALEGLEVAPPAAFLSDAEAPSLAADAEAIHVQNLALDEIEALADARNADSIASALEGPADPVADRVRLLVIPGGSATKRISRRWRAKRPCCRTSWSGGSRRRRSGSSPAAPASPTAKSICAASPGAAGRPAEPGTMSRAPISRTRNGW